MKQFKSLICLLLALLLLSGCAPAAPAQSDASTEPAQTEEAAPAEQTEQAEPEAATEEMTGPEADFITVTDHNDNVVQVPKNAQRIAVCDILPLPSVLCVFFDSAEKLVGIAPSSMSAAQNSLLSQLYSEILNAQTGYMNGTDVNTEELMQLAPDVVFYSASNPALGEKLTASGFCAIAVSANKWQYNCIETLNNWIGLLSQIFPENDRAALCRSYSEDVYAMVQERVKDIPDAERARAFFLFQYNDSTIMTSGQLFFGQWWADAIGAVNVANELATDNSVTVNLEQVYDWNPDIIFMTNFNTFQPDDLYHSTVGTYDWSGIQAVQDKSVYKMPLGMYRSYTPGIDTPITLLWMAKTTYPARFEDIDVTQKAIDYYETVFGVTLTPEQVESIFAPISAAGALYF
jgi:iron complex transport system substrate-binding protein